MVVLEMAAAGKSLGLAASGLDLVLKMASSGGLDTALAVTVPSFGGAHAGGALIVTPAGAVVGASGAGHGAAAGLGTASTGLAGDVQLLSDQIAAYAGSTMASLASAFSWQALGYPACTMGTTACGWAVYHKFLHLEDAPEDEQPLGGLLSFAPPALLACALNDSYIVGTLLNSIGHHLASPLRLWAVGGLLLSFPASWLIDAVAKAKPGMLRCAFVMETGLAFASFAWLTWGTMLLSHFPVDAAASPMLWWSCFGQCVFTWSWIGMGLASIIIMSVMSHLLAAK